LVGDRPTVLIRNSNVNTLHAWNVGALLLEHRRALVDRDLLVDLSGHVVADTPVLAGLHRNRVAGLSGNCVAALPWNVMAVLNIVTSLARNLGADLLRSVHTVQLVFGRALPVLNSTALLLNHRLATFRRNISTFHLPNVTIVQFLLDILTLFGRRS
jgi:hypothetical protein